MLTLTVAFSENSRVDPLAEGAVKPQAIDLQFVRIHPGDLFFRNLKYDEFDVSEMSISEYIMTRERRDGSKWDWSGLPVFLSKAFWWLNFYVNSESGIRDLSDLRGKRLGSPDYPSTAALWLRIFLKELYGINPQEITWYNGRTREHSHAGILELDRTPPGGVKLNFLSQDQTFAAMLDQGELDAAYGIALDNIYTGRTRMSTLDRYSGTQIEGNPRIRPLFPDSGRQIILDFYKKTGVLPCNHMVVVQNRVLEKHPWVALELFTAFQKSKELAYQRAREAARGYLLFDAEDFKKQSDVFGNDPYPQGFRANRKMFEIITRGSFEQGLTKKQANVDDLFYRTTLGT